MSGHDLLNTHALGLYTEAEVRDLLLQASRNGATDAKRLRREIREDIKIQNRFRMSQLARRAKGTAAARERAKKAAKARWGKAKAKKD
jgi:hypothetical protein